jgi:hypothetical protein
METMHIRCAGFSAAVDAYARDDADLWFVSLLGNQQSVRALWARLLKGEPAVLSDHALMGGRYCELAREARGATRFHAAKLPVTGATHGMLIPEQALYVGERFDFLLLARSEADAPALHYRFLSRRVDLPLHPLWADWLWKRGLARGEVRPLDALGVHAWRCVPDQSDLKQALGRALRGHRIPLPAGEPADAA